jgi:hypothetical protein
VTWNDEFVQGNSSFLTVDAQIYDPNGNTVGGKITVFPQFQDDFDTSVVFATPDGGFACAEALEGASAVNVRAFRADGTASGAAIPEGSDLQDLDTSIALTNGDTATLVIGVSNNGNFNDFQVYDSAGTQLVANTPIANGSAVNADIAALPDGRFVVVYETPGPNGTGGTIDAQGFNSNGKSFLDEIGVNDGAVNQSGGQGLPHVAVMPDGRFIVAWHDSSGDSNNNLTEARVFDPNGNTASAVFAIPGSAENPNWEPNDVAALSDTSFAISWNTGTGITSQILTIQAPPDVADNFIGYGTSDVLLQSGSSVIDWILSNGVFASFNTIGNAGSYGIVGSGDFNGDGTTDILLENGGGNVIDWILQNGVYQSYSNIGSPGGYGVVGTGDYNGDGTGDVLLENGSGNLIDWTMQKGTFAGWNEIGSSGGYGVVGKGDFNGDGTSDVLLENGSRNLIDWVVQNGTFAGWGEISNPAAAGYGVVGTGDFNGDGTTDVLLANGSGNIIDWIIQDGTFAGWNEVGNTGGYGVVGTGDYNRDGTTDILLENASGSIIDWTVHNGTFSGWKGVGNASGYGVDRA